MDKGWPLTEEEPEVQGGELTQLSSCTVSDGRAGIRFQVCLRQMTHSALTKKHSNKQGQGCAFHAASGDFEPLGLGVLEENGDQEIKG